MEASFISLTGMLDNIIFFFTNLQIQDGQIHALINQKDGMVRFLEDPEQYKSSEMIEIMDSVIQRYVYRTKCFDMVFFWETLLEC